MEEFPRLDMNPIFRNSGDEFTPIDLLPLIILTDITYVKVYLSADVSLTIRQNIE